jgi:O-antigen/teichoic acid export membrane protein
MASLSVVQSLATLAIVALAYVRQGGLAEILAAYMVGKMIGALSLTAAALVEAGRRWGADWWRTSLSSLRSHFRPLAVFAISTNLSASLSLINKDSESLWITFFRATEEAGFYKQALALVNLVQMPVSPLPQATYPELSREVARKNWKNIRYILRQGSLLAGGFTVTASLVLFFFGKPIIRLLYTEEYLPAYPALLILLVGFLFANTFYWNRTALLALGRPDFPTKVNSVLAVMKIAGFLLFVPRYGYLASAALLSASYVLGTSISAIKVYSLISTQERVIEQGEASIQRVIR